MEELERMVMARMLSGDFPVVPELRAQYAVASVASREFSGVGFFTNYSVPSHVSRVAPPNLELSEGAILTTGISVGFTLFVRDGLLSMLEGYTYDQPWPDDATIERWEEAPE
jgi:hypothetical protein